MAQDRLILEPEVQSILQCIDNGQNFLLSGGAGSGKTYSLVQVIRQVIEEFPHARVACMTYTNAAVKEIEERVDHSNLNVSTIHDFLWDTIKHFQKELKVAVVDLANDEEVTGIKIEGVTPVPANFFDVLEDGIQYKEYVKIRDGIISHDELLLVANRLFASYPKLSSIVKDRYKFIFIDEYQDTSTQVVDIFLTQFQQSLRPNIIGFFGDAMQSIYDDTIGNLNAYIGNEPGQVREIQKAQNRRNPLQIIGLANTIRTDGLMQTPSSDPTAPNMANGVVKNGRILFLHSQNGNIDAVKSYLSENYQWDFLDAKETKELNLTHNLIADKAGFRTLMDIYDKDQVLKYRDRIKKYVKDNDITEDFTGQTFGNVIDFLKNGKSGAALRAVEPTNGMNVFIADHPDLLVKARTMEYDVFSKMYVDKDQLVDDKKKDIDDEGKKGTKRDNLVKHLFKIQTNISLYQTKQYNEFLRITDYRDKIVSIAQKRILKENIEILVDVSEKTIEEIIAEADAMGIAIIDDRVSQFTERQSYLYDRVKSVPFREFQKLFDYLEGKTPFSTQHKTKGTEFDNVLVILDNGSWNKYNFENLFLAGGTPSVLDRTQKIFYVCCTRAKENLTVYYCNPPATVIAQASVWFGADNVVEIPN
ncbi:UvrD-helicase domain-containing protein [Daejeonella sp.]|uniref:UvrD-helicase domain-containing protein n=1 Tax=Daejeonella sp. TaxID=2805397 RepID=UPI0030C1DD39